MFWFILFLFLSVSYLLGSIIWRFYRLFRPKKYNPYISVHLQRRHNDKNYEDYLKWLNKTGGNLPIEKYKTKEEQDFERVIKENL